MSQPTHPQADGADESNASAEQLRAVQQQVVAALDAGDLETALHALRAGIEATSGTAQERLRLIQAQLLLSLGEHAAVVTVLEDGAFTSTPFAVEASLLRAEALLADGRVSDAQQAVDHLLEQLYAADTTDVLRAERQRGHLLGASLARHLQQPALALQHLRQLGELVPELVSQARYEEALALRDVGQAQQAASLLATLLHDADLGAMARAQLPPTLAMLGDVSAATEAAERLVADLAPGPERAQALYNLAVLRREASDMQGTEAALEAALAEPEREPVLAGQVLLLQGILRRELEDAQGALDAFRQVAELQPTPDLHGRARLEIGATLAATGLFGIAGEELTAAIALCADPDDRARALRLRSMARQEMQMLDMALDDLAAAAPLTTHPLERAQGEVQRAALLLRRERRVEALQVARDAIPVGYVPDDDEDEDASRLYVQRGALRSELGDLDGATEDLRTAIALAQMREDASLQAAVLADLGAIEMARGDLDAARAVLEAAAQLEPSGPAAVTALSTLGQVLLAQDEPLAALEAWERAAGAAQDDRDARARAFLLRANAELRLDELVQAEADYQRVLTLQPSRVYQESATIGLRGVQSQLESLRSAREDLAAALRGAGGEGPTYRLQLLLRRGQLALTAGDHEAALADFTRAAAIDGLHGERRVALGWLALALARTGQSDEALSALHDAFASSPGQSAVDQTREGWVSDLRGNWRWGSLREHAAFPEALR